MAALHQSTESMSHRSGGYSDRPIAERAGAKERVKHASAGRQRTQPLCQAHGMEHSAAGGAGAGHARCFTCTCKMTEAVCTQGLCSGACW
jgi:hypothetical protein